MKIHIISHEPCPCEVCLVHIYVLGNKTLIAGLCYLLLPPIFFCLQHQCIDSYGQRQAVHSTHHPRIHRHTYKHMYSSTHKMTPKRRKQTQQLPSIFFPSFWLSVQYVPQISSVNSKCARQSKCNAVHAGGWSLRHRHRNRQTSERLETHKSLCTCMVVQQKKKKIHICADQTNTDSLRHNDQAV